MQARDLVKFSLTDAPGVYYFLKGKKILYVGKATSIKDRVKSYFMKDILLTRGPKILKMLEEADTVAYQATDSALEALILEANEIRKHQPPANSRDKDDKSYNYVVITKEEFPRILLIRGRELAKVTPLSNTKVLPLYTFGPFPHGSELREALKIVRKIFPYSDSCTPCEALAKKGKPCKPCFNAQIGLCPGPCAGRISKADYRKQIRNIALFFEGKKDTLIKTLEKEMKALAKAEKFEEAEMVKRQLFALNHIQDVALIKQGLTTHDRQPTTFRIEAYDVAHISGTNVVGVMTVVEDGELAKSEYRKFKIRGGNPTSRKATAGQGNNDTKNLKEILTRRLNHPEWPFPNLIVVDGGVGQINAAKEVLKERGLEIAVVSVVKDERHKAKQILGLTEKVRPFLNSQGRTFGSEVLDRAILLANSEAHRFAINYHRLLRSKGFRI